MVHRFRLFGIRTCTAAPELLAINVYRDGQNFPRVSTVGEGVEPFVLSSIAEAADSLAFS